MQLKLFRSSAPPPAFKRDIELLLSLNPDNLNKFVQWFSTLPDFMSIESSELSALPPDFPLNPDEIVRVAALIRFVLANKRSLRLTLEDIESDFRALEYDPKQQETLKLVFKSVDSIDEKVHLSMIQRVYETMGLPSVDDVNLVWDVRPIFEDFAYAVEPSKGDPANLLTHSYVLIIEFEISRADGKNETTSFQVSERDLGKITEALTRAQKQLEVLKLRYRAEI